MHIVLVWCGGVCAELQGAGRGGGERKRREDRPKSTDGKGRKEGREAEKTEKAKKQRSRSTNGWPKHANERRVIANDDDDRPAGELQTDYPQEDRPRPLAAA